MMLKGVKSRVYDAEKSGDAIKCRAQSLAENSQPKENKRNCDFRLFLP